MHKISYYVVAAVVLGSAVTSFWIYERYLKVPDQPFLYFTVDRGDIQESVKVRSEVVPEKEFQLEFPFSGTVEHVYVSDGETVVAGQRLLSLDTKGLDSEAGQLAAVIAAREADLAKLRAGATAAELSVSEAELLSAQVALQEAHANLIDKIRDAYAKADDSVRAKTDQLFDNVNSTSPTLKSAVRAGATARDDLNFQRPALGVMLEKWNPSIATLDATSVLSGPTDTARQNVAQVSVFLNTLSPVVNSLTENGDLSQATIDKYRTDLSTARTSVSTAIANLAAAEEKYNLAAASVTLYERQLVLKRAPARMEDLEAASARVQEAKEQLASVNERMRRSVLTAPTAGKVVEIHYESGEVFRQGTSALSMVTTGYKLQSDVSELDIAKVRAANGSSVRIQFDAFPGEEFTGKVATIDSQEVTKVEDKYYRVNTIFDAKNAEVRSGMSADATILSVLKKGVLRIPELAVYNDGKIRYVKTLRPGLPKAVSEDSLERVEVGVGVSDGDFVEIRSGLTEGQTVVVSAD